jgi:hypothetical protein
VEKAGGFLGIGEIFWIVSPVSGLTTNGKYETRTEVNFVYCIVIYVYVF